MHYYSDCFRYIIDNKYFSPLREQEDCVSDEFNASALISPLKSTQHSHNSPDFCLNEKSLDVDFCDNPIEIPRGPIEKKHQHSPIEIPRGPIEKKHQHNPIEIPRGPIEKKHQHNPIEIPRGPIEKKHTILVQ